MSDRHAYFREIMDGLKRDHKIVFRPSANMHQCMLAIQGGEDHLQAYRRLLESLSVQCVQAAPGELHVKGIAALARLGQVWPGIDSMLECDPQIRSQVQTYSVSGGLGMMVD